MRYGIRSIGGLAVALSACGGHDPSPGDTGPPPDIRGYFAGTITETNNGQSTTTSAIAIGTTRPGVFEVATLAGYRQFEADVGSTSDTGFSGTARAFHATSTQNGLNAFVKNVGVSGTDAAGNLSGTFDVGNGVVDSFSLTDQPSIYETPTSIASLVGSWDEQQSQGYTLNIGIDSNGHATGGDGSCTYTADFASADAQADLFSVDEALHCAQATTTLSGVAVHIPQGSGTGVREQIVVLTVGDSQAAARVFVRSGS
jgi:hypothetical protein